MGWGGVAAVVACVDCAEVSVDWFPEDGFGFPVHGSAGVRVGTGFNVVVGVDGRVFFGVAVVVVVVRVYVLEFFWGDEFVVGVGGEGIVIRIFGVDGFGGVDGGGGESAMGAVVVRSID